MMRAAVYILAVLMIFFSAACARNSFVKENLKTFHEFKLKNNIPVIVKTARHSRINSVVLAVKGGKALVSSEQAGLDKLMLQLMKMESKKYPDVKKRAILKRTSASIGAGDGLDYTTYHLKTIDSYFEETFDLYADLFLNPVFPEKFFNEVITNLKNKYRSDLTDGYARVSLAINRNFFADHPYDSYLYNPETLDNITLEDVKAFYRKNMVASRMIIFAAGDFDMDSLQNKLDGTFGNIDPGTPADTRAAGFTLDPQPPLILDPYADLNKEVSYVRGNFETVSITHKDYWAMVLATKIVSDIMTDIIRTQNSMVYSVWTHAYGKKSNYASISAFRTNNPIKVVDLIHRSIDIAASGKCLSPFTAEGTGNDYVPIAEGLPFYKTSFATGFYSGLQNNTSIAKKMADSYMLTHDYTNYLKVMHRIRAVSAEDVQQAIAVYIQNANINWAISAHPETIEMIQKDYASYAPTYRRIDLE